jgi:hypothetical protein
MESTDDEQVDLKNLDWPSTCPSSGGKQSVQRNDKLSLASSRCEWSRTLSWVKSLCKQRGRSALVRSGCRGLLQSSLDAFCQRFAHVLVLGPRPAGNQAAVHNKGMAIDKAGIVAS